MFRVSVFFLSTLKKGVGSISNQKKAHKHVSVHFCKPSYSLKSN